MLSIDDLKSRVSVDDDEVRSYYENNLAGYQTEEERRVSHGNVAAAGLHRDVVVAGRDRAALDANLGDRGLQNHEDEFSNSDKPCQIFARDC